MIETSIKKELILSYFMSKQECLNVCNSSFGFEKTLLVFVHDTCECMFLFFQLLSGSTMVTKVAATSAKPDTIRFNSTLTSTTHLTNFIFHYLYHKETLSQKKILVPKNSLIIQNKF